MNATKSNLKTCRSDMEFLCARRGVTISNTTGNTAPVDDDWKLSAHPWTCTLRFEKRRLTVPFWQGPAHTKEPTAADVLSCLVGDAWAADVSFEDWCSDLGFDTDSRQAGKTYKACRKIGPRVRKFLGEHFDEFAKAEH